MMIVNVVHIVIMTTGVGEICRIFRISGIIVGKRVITSGMEGVTMADPFRSEPETLPESVAAYRFERVLRARRIKPADTVGHGGGNEALVCTKDCCRHFD